MGLQTSWPLLVTEWRFRLLVRRPSAQSQRRRMALNRRAVAVISGQHVVTIVFMRSPPSYREVFPYRSHEPPRRRRYVPPVCRQPLVEEFYLNFASVSGLLAFFNGLFFSSPSFSALFSASTSLLFLILLLHLCQCLRFSFFLSYFYLLVYPLILAFLYYLFLSLISLSVFLFPFCSVLLFLFILLFLCSTVLISLFLLIFLSSFSLPFLYPTFLPFFPI